jgi:ATP-binding cassette subfamily B protein
MHTNDKYLLTQLLKDLKPQKFILICGLLLYVPVTILAIIQPLIIGYAVQQGLLYKNIQSVINFSLIFLLVVISLSLCELLQGYCLQLSGQRLVSYLRMRVFAKIQRLSMGFIDTTPLGKILTRLTNDAESVAELFSMGAVQIVGDVLFLLSTVVMLVLVDIKLTFYSALILPLLAIGLYFFRIWTKRAFVRVRHVLSNLNSFLQEYISGMSTVQISDGLKNCEYNFAIQNKEYLYANRQAVFLEAAIYSFVDASSYLASAAVLWGAYKLELNHALSLGVLVAFLEALMRFFQPLREMANRYAVFESAMVSLSRIYEVFSWPEEHDKPGVTHIYFENSIEFQHVSFAYEKGGAVLKDVSLKIKKGEHVALVGQTGAGKSTVIKLLNRFYHVSSGQILIDKRNINTFSLGELRKLISVVPQDIFLFNASLRENLTFGNPDASDKIIWDALKLTQLEDIIQQKGGLAILVERRGQNFSVGERQLLAFARAIIADPPILILDEATASVDARTEHNLKLATKALLHNRTALIIAHRLSTIIDADRILVFEQGQIVEEGSHSELIARSGIYARMIQFQQTTF